MSVVAGDLVRIAASQKKKIPLKMKCKLLNSFLVSSRKSFLNLRVDERV